MRIYGPNWLKASVSEKLRAASRTGMFDGLMTSAAQIYLERCKAFHASTGSLLIFTRDSGHHSSGWFKNPEFELCLHLSLSFHEPFQLHKQATFSQALADEWVDCVFGEKKKLAWRETAKSPEGRALEVVHWRVFCDAHWFPIYPRGEVYSREFTEKGWQSWSDLHGDTPEPSILHAG